MDTVWRRTVIALPTTYRGVEFRSRLEATWAVFFDWLHLRWEYEKEGYDLNGLWYLPDFWMPQLDCWIEIKGPEPTRIEKTKAERLCCFSGKEVFIFQGQHTVPPDNPVSAEVYYPSADVPGGCGWDNEQWFCECPDCHKVGIAYTGRSDRLECKECFVCWSERKLPQRMGMRTLSNLHEESHREGGCPRHGGNGDRGHNYDSPRLIEAYSAARSERFGT